MTKLIVICLKFASAPKNVHYMRKIQCMNSVSCVLTVVSWKFSGVKVISASKRNV
jgi:hypothetical protein